MTSILIRQKLRTAVRRDGEQINAAVTVEIAKQHLPSVAQNGGIDFEQSGVGVRPTVAEIARGDETFVGFDD